MEFVKMHGTGNDFILIKDLEENLVGNEVEIAKKVCHRRFGIGADGLVLIRKSNVADIKMVIINSDGSRANMCGNAIRCFAKYAFENSLINKKIFNVETGDGVKEVELLIKDESSVSTVKVCMGKASFDGKDIPLSDKSSLINENITANGKEYLVTTVLVGVPHTIILVKDDEYNVFEGKYIEKHSMFMEGTNVNFVKVIDNKNIDVKTWERGAGATYSCGTGCSAAVAVTKMLNKTEDRVHVTVPGGELIIEIIDEYIYMSGSAEAICKGIVL